MSATPETWTVEHFSQANPAGPGQDDVPALLRRVAAALEELGPLKVQDLVVHWDVTEDGDWPSVTVYFRRGAQQSGAEASQRGLSRALRRPWTVVTDAPAALGRLAWPPTWPARRGTTPPSGSSTPASAD